MKSITALTGISDERAFTLKLRSSVSSTTSLYIFFVSPTRINAYEVNRNFSRQPIQVINLPSACGLSTDDCELFLQRLRQVANILSSLLPT